MSDEQEAQFLTGTGGRIRDRRDAAGLKLQELATLTGLSVSALSNIETGKRDLRLTTLRRIAQALRVPLADLVEDKRDRPPEKRASADDETYDLGDYN
ncbi:helix-turn-helix domain-containing protein [Henriciella aquimarina]|uniref:helix-turn-helix domain-containing protein n=1 Tax=Henriciella aquimarina TaxID=545261 RepID=UPI000A033202|nr:helix-turn-helix transcriptional regulator [Henriciella aquimarina]